MRTVLPADQIAHLWIHRAQDNARTPSDNFSFCGDTLSSYSTPIAHILPDDYGRALIFNDYHYSNTTSKHQSHARRAISGNVWRIFYVDGLDRDDIRNVARTGTAAIRSRMMESMRAAILAAATPRIRDTTRQSHIARAENIAADIRDLANVDAKLKTLDKEKRAEARAVLRRLPGQEAMRAAQESKDGAVALAQTFARDKARENMNRHIASVRATLKSFAGAQAQAVMLAEHPEARAWCRDPARRALLAAQDTLDGLKAAAQYAKTAGARLPRDVVKACDALAERLPELQNARLGEERASNLASWGEMRKRLEDERDAAKLADYSDNNWHFSRLGALALELSATDSDAEKVERAQFIANMQAARVAQRAMTAPERFATIVACFDSAAQTGRSWRHCAELIRRAADVAEDANETDAPSMRERLAAMRARYENGTKEERERALAAWYAGQAPRSLPEIAQYVDGTARLRVVGDTIETSQGADVPLSVAPMLWRAVARARALGKGTEYAMGEGPRLGHYRLDRINMDGSIQAGCHRIAFCELERVAAALGYAANVEAFEALANTP